MNLIACNKNCAHQADGYCNLTHSLQVNTYQVDGCCYFKKCETVSKTAKPQKIKSFL